MTRALPQALRVCDIDSKPPLPDILSPPTGPFVLNPLLDGSQGGPRLSLVLPTYNESRNIAKLLVLLTDLLDSSFGKLYEIIVVDDDSPDRTWEMAQTLTAAYPAVRVMRRRDERGLSTAVIRGWQAARGEMLAVMDADLQHPPEVILALCREIDAGADIAIASRHVEGGSTEEWNATRRILSRCARLIGLAILPKIVRQVTDPMSGYFIVRRSMLEGVTLKPLGYKILLEVLGRGECRLISEVPYSFCGRLEGESKVTPTIYLQYVLHLLRLRTADLPIYRFARFVAVGAIGVVIDMGVLFILSDASTFGLGLIWSKALAAQAAIVNNFIWNDLWTFADVTHKKLRFAQRMERFWRFELICLAGVLFSIGLLYLQAHTLGVNRYLANVIAIASATAWNFGMNRKFSWRV